MDELDDLPRDLRIAARKKMIAAQGEALAEALEAPLPILEMSLSEANALHEMVAQAVFMVGLRGQVADESISAAFRQIIVAVGKDRLTRANTRDRLQVVGQSGDEVKHG